MSKDGSSQSVWKKQQKSLLRYLTPKNENTVFQHLEKIVLLNSYTQIHKGKAVYSVKEINHFLDLECNLMVALNFQ